MKATMFCAVSVLVSLADGGIADALGASAPPSPRTPVSPVSAALPSPDVPVGEPVPRVPAGSLPNPKATPMPVPAPTDHYGGGKFFRNG